MEKYKVIKVIVRGTVRCLTERLEAPHTFLCKGPPGDWKWLL